MSVAFTRLSWWLLGGKHQEPKVSGESPRVSTPDSGACEPDNLKFPLIYGGNIASKSRKVKRKWPSREERKTDGEYDAVMVPSDGGCVSGSESDDLDWLVGWLEPHGPDFQTETESDNSFAVLVPCYGRGRKEMEEEKFEDKFLNAIGKVPDMYAAENKKFMEQWLSYLQYS